jgi:hypothetical protein
VRTGHRYETGGIAPCAIYKLTVGFGHRLLFRVTNYAFKCSERYKLNVGDLRLLQTRSQPVLDPPVGGFTKCATLGYCFGLASSFVVPRFTNVSKYLSLPQLASDPPQYTN